MELPSRPRHQLRAQGRRRDQVGVVFSKHERRARWRPIFSTPAAEQPGQNSSAVAVMAPPAQPVELLDFLARTAVESEKELLLEYVNQVELPPSADSFARFKRSLGNVHGNDRTSFRRTKEDETRRSQESSSVATEAPTMLVQTESEHCRYDVAEEGTWGCEADETSDALRTLLGALNDWLSAGNSTKPVMALKTSDASESTEYSPANGNGIYNADSNGRAANNGKNGSSSVGMLVLDKVGHDRSDERSPQLEPSPELKGFSLDVWRNPLASSVAGAPNAVPTRRPTLLSALQETISQAQVRIKTLPQGRRLECHDNGAVLEKDEFGRVTQVRIRSGEILSVYYGQDGAAEGFVRTDARGRLHSVGDVDTNGVTVRDNNGRLRAAGESLSIDSGGKLSICRSDGQYWSLDLVRELMVEKRKLCSDQGAWTSMTAIFAADGFRMITIFEEVGDPAAAALNLSKLCPDRGRFRFYGRDGSMIEFLSEQELVSLAPTYVSAPGVRAIEPKWQSKHQAGTAWNSVQEFLLINQSA